ncbi:MAG: thioredoxin [Acidobacteriaceae bacterium]|nr:thioredoxin [Acidobacteriaceae bacterium]
MAGDKTLNFTDGNFESEVLKSEIPVLVDFWAEWCGPCRMMTPTIDAIANDFAGRVKVGKVNVEEAGATSERYRVRNIPTLLLFKDGKVVESQVGAVGKPALLKLLEKHVQSVQSA